MGTDGGVSTEDDSDNESSIRCHSNANPRNRSHTLCQSHTSLTSWNKFANPRPICQSDANHTLIWQSEAHPRPIRQYQSSNASSTNISLTSPIRQFSTNTKFSTHVTSPIIQTGLAPISHASATKTEDKLVTNLGTRLLWGPTTGLVGGRIGQCHPSYLWSINSPTIQCQTWHNMTIHHQSTNHEQLCKYINKPPIQYNQTPFLTKPATQCKSHLSNKVATRTIRQKARD